MFQLQSDLFLVFLVFFSSSSVLQSATKASPFFLWSFTVHLNWWSTKWVPTESSSIPIQFSKKKKSKHFLFNRSECKFWPLDGCSDWSRIRENSKKRKQVADETKQLIGIDSSFSPRGKRVSSLRMNKLREDNLPTKKKNIRRVDRSRTTHSSLVYLFMVNPKTLIYP
jgi:hypothetical protein